MIKEWIDKVIWEMRERDMKLVNNPFKRLTSNRTIMNYAVIYTTDKYKKIETLRSMNHIR